MFQKLFAGKDRIFQPLFNKQAALIRQAGNELLALIESTQQARLEDKQKAINALEHQGDDCVRETLQKLYTTFFAPYDHEDIKELSRALDNILDEIDFVAGQMAIYGFECADESMKSLARVVQRGTGKVYELVTNIGDVEKNKLIFDALDAIEDEGDRKLAQSLHRLFAENKDALHILKYKELYERLEKATDHCKDISDIVEGIVLKYS